MRLLECRDYLFTRRMRVLSLPIILFRQGREGTNLLVLTRRRSTGPSELGVELIRGHPKLKGEGPIENLRREHVGRFVHVHGADDEEVSWQLEPLRFHV